MCWQVYDKVFAIFNKVLALHQYQVQDRHVQNWAERRNKFLIKVMLRLFYLIITIWALSTVCPLSACVSLSPGASPDPRTKSHYCKSVDITTEQLIISPRSLFCLTDYCKVFRIAKCSQQCLIFKSRPGEERSDPLEALQTILIPGRCSQVTKLKCEADAHSLNKLLISASSNAVFAGVGPWLSL